MIICWCSIVSEVKAICPFAELVHHWLVFAGSTYEEIIDQLSSNALQAALQLCDNQQYIIGIGGCPGSGKTTLSREVARRLTVLCTEHGLTRTAVVAPMDGFHFYKKQLDQMPDPKVSMRSLVSDKRQL